MHEATIAQMLQDDVLSVLDKRHVHNSHTIPFLKETITSQYLYERRRALLLKSLEHLSALSRFPEWLGAHTGEYELVEHILALLPPTLPSTTLWRKKITILTNQLNDIIPKNSKHLKKKLTSVLQLPLRELRKETETTFLTTYREALEGPPDIEPISTLYACVRIL